MALSRTWSLSYSTGRISSRIVDRRASVVIDSKLEPVQAPYVLHLRIRVSLRFATALPSMTRCRCSLPLASLRRCGKESSNSQKSRREDSLSTFVDSGIILSQLSRRVWTTVTEWTFLCCCSVIESGLIGET